jgi:hypothetical protein
VKGGKFLDILSNIGVHGQKASSKVSHYWSRLEGNEKLAAVKAVFKN